MANNQATNVINLIRIAAIVAVFLLVSCSSTSKYNASNQSNRTSLNSGGYYLDDGPGENPPINLDTIPDATPKIEPLREANMRPYTALGKSYQPMTMLDEYKEQGVASWYGRRYHGNQTASGEVYDMYAMTAAHPTLPLPSYVRVTNIQNGKVVVVRVNDRGPFLAERIIDLSYTAAHKLDIIASGSGMVEVESILPGKHLDTTQVQPQQVPDIEPAMSQSPIAMTDIDAIYLQLGAFGTENNALNFLSHMQSELPWLGGNLGIAEENGLFKIKAGPFSNLILARQTANEITQQLEIYPMVLID
ncbi:MAG: septal ring lytic transglycosylase RlpA family protein [Nitrosomonas sp.]|nr:septal ring lytic transglycosylase RlpA family protein [Nitrosomonas sp.]